MSPLGPSSTIVVTGGAGFIGSHVCDRFLAEGKRVIAIDDLSTGHIANLAEARGYGQRFTFYNVGVRAEGLPGIFQRHEPQVVYHLAGRREDPVAFDPVAEAGLSVMGLLNVLQACVAAQVAKVVVASSAGIYGETRKLPIKETSAATARPLTPAAIGKGVAEDYLRFYQRYRGLDFTLLVPGSVYGPRQYPADGAGAVGALAGTMLAGATPQISGDGNQTRDFVFVDDVVHAFALAAERGSGRLLNVGTALETSVNGLFRMLADILRFKGEPTYVPARPGDRRRSALDNALAEHELGWKPWTHLEDGLRETVAFLKGT